MSKKKSFKLSAMSVDSFEYISKLFQIIDCEDYESNYELEERMLANVSYQVWCSAHPFTECLYEWHIRFRP